MNAITGSYIYLAYLRRNTMTRLDTTMLNDPFFIGFDRMIDRMSRSTPGQQSYPPYNIIRTGDETYELQLAIAGFKYDDLDITLKEGMLSIEGKQDSDDERKYLHKGISARSFKRTFTLMETIKVDNASLVDGILTVFLENIIPEEKKAQKIKINREDKSEREFLKG
jgi:molecular chaperone IbpA|tara:strand:+ start:81 stop:581 length:501 start_codon:yes stop_codon:yes gene_type:complete